MGLENPKKNPKPSNGSKKFLWAWATTPESNYYQGTWQLKSMLGVLSCFG